MIVDLPFTRVESSQESFSCYNFSVKLRRVLDEVAKVHSCRIFLKGLNCESGGYKKSDNGWDQGVILSFFE